MSRFLAFFTVSKFRTFLIGILLGQVLMIPQLYRLRAHPKIEAVPVPDYIFREEMSTRTYIMHDVPQITNLGTRKKDLTIVLTTEANVHKEYFKRYGEETTTVLGFYDREKHKIICIDSTDILVHEMRHIFEGAFHQS